MTRLPAVVFAALAAATVGAFFLTQHLKVSFPLIGGSPRSVPSAINPISGGVCEFRGRPIRFDRAWISFWLPHSDTVAVYIFNRAGQTVDTVTAKRRMTAHVRDAPFYWDGRQSGGAYAPDGTYYWAFALDRENRTVELTSDPITVITATPHPVVTGVTVAGASPATQARAAGRSASAGPALITPPRQSVTIHFTRGDYRSAAIMLWRTDTGKPRLVKQYPVSHPKRGVARWNGLINGRPAPAGTYMVGLQVKDQACNEGTFPTAQPPVIPEPGTGVTVRYLAAQPPLGPVPAGSTATVYVDSRLRPYTWSLRVAGLAKAIAHGSEPGRAYVLHVRLPPGAAGLYDLTINSANHSTSVPLVANATAGADAAARVLVVLPMLTWQGENPVDDNGWGLPDTLTAGDRIELQRPLVDGLPAGFVDQAALLRYLRASHLSFQLTTDVALALSAAHPTGPRLSDHRGVILDGAFSWLPRVLVSQLNGYVRSGGRLLSTGTGSLQGVAPLRLSGRTLTAGPPAPLSPDPFGAQHGAVSTTAGELITAQSDPLGIFAPAMAVTGFRDFQTITPPSGVTASIGGVAAAAPTIVGFRNGKGTVVEVGLPAFASSLQRNVGSQQLLGRIWKLLSS